MVDMRPSVHRTARQINNDQAVRRMATSGGRNVGPPLKRTNGDLSNKDVDLPSGYLT